MKGRIIAIHYPIHPAELLKESFNEGSYVV